MEIILQIGRCHCFLACQHFVCIAADRVDLPVMYNKTVRMCTLPARICVGAETGMYGSDRRFIIRTLQIGKEFAELSYEKHTLVDDGSAGE